MTDISYQNYGLAGLSTEDFTQSEILAGDTPAVVSDYAILGSSLAVTGIAAFTPIYVDPTDRSITLAVAGSVDPQDDVAPNAITICDIAAGTAATSTVPVWKAAMLNVDKVNWPASFSTDALKFSAFNMAECQLYVKRPYYG